MTKQEEIGEWIAKRLRFIACFRVGIDWEALEEVERLTFRADATQFLKYLDSQGVVIKAENQTIWLLEASEAYKKGQSDLLEAGYVAVEPLIKDMTISYRSSK